MLAPTSFSYREVAILSDEAIFALGIDEHHYRAAVDSGLLELSVDLCPARPGKLMVHNFWDLLKYLFLTTPLSCRNHAPPFCISVIDDILDDIASMLEEAGALDSDAEADCWNLDDQICETITAYMQDLPPESISRLLTAWRLTAGRVAISLAPDVGPPILVS